MKLAPKDYEYRRTEGSVSSINYHFIFVPKRRKAVLIQDVAKRLQAIVFDLVTEHNWKLIALEIMPDIVYTYTRLKPRSRFHPPARSRRLSTPVMVDSLVDCQN